MVVSDLGRLSELELHDDDDLDAVTTRWLVVRGRCYLSLRAALEETWRPDGIVVLTEPRRPLVAADVSDVLGAPVIAQVPIEAAVARIIIDAGLLLGRLHRLSAFSGIAKLVRPPDLPRAGVRGLRRRYSGLCGGLPPGPDHHPARLNRRS
ncbi:MAG TPA: hypothetical protein VK988_03550, partial [Acidimicrobiales bacterium]|nr:hypothetical protein [Acidimicrobiales bacterium]